QAVGVANPVNPLLETQHLAGILRAAGTRVLVALGPVPGSDIWNKVLQLQAQLPGLRAILAVGGHGVATATPHDAFSGAANSEGAAPILDFDALLDTQPLDAVRASNVIAPSDTAAYFHTGGTTGTPKLVRHTHANQVYQAWVIALMLRARPGEAVLFGLPLFHVGGALTQGLATLAAGGHLVVLSPAGWRSPAAQRNVWQLAARYRPRNFSSVPTVLAAALHFPREGLDLSSIAYASGGGSAIPVSVARGYAERLGWPVLEVYGMTETSSVHTISYLDRPIRIGTVGHAVPSSRVRVLKAGADGRLTVDCATDEIGVVAMAGPGVFSGYLGRSGDDAFVEPGWVNSGDLGRIDADGYLWITG
ncbi:MAG: AMP-binding protein, partial [Gammaproteobacteria bacterium]